MAGRYAGPLTWLVERPIAHRGFHDGNATVFENSLPAFEAAIASGYSIECDVQLSSDGTPHVFHDRSLGRLTGRDADIRLTGDAALKGLRLGSTDAAIPTVAEFLSLVAGRVPVVVELKGLGPAEDEGYLDALSPVVNGYRGHLAIMSFDEWLIDQALGAGLNRPVGLTAEGTQPEALDRHAGLFERGCAFVSYNIHHLPNSFTERLRAQRLAPVISWTVRTQTEAERSRANADQMTFEGFTPQDGTLAE